MTDFSRKRSSARRNGCGLSVCSVFAQRARNADSGRAWFARPGVCRHTFHFGQKTASADKTGASSVIDAYAWSMQDNERIPGCNEDAARSPRQRLQRSCKQYAPKSPKWNESRVREAMRMRRVQKQEGQVQQNTSEYAGTCSNRRKTVQPKPRKLQESTKKNVAMDKNMCPWALAVAKNVQTNGWNMNVHIAMWQSTAP